MKAILYFVAAGIVLPRHQDAAKALSGATGKRVVFRNADTGSTEKPEANEGVAGKVPDNYVGFESFGDDGKVSHKGEQAAAPAPVAGDERTLNSIGLPEGDGCPATRDELKKALEAEGIEYHGNASTDKLVALYMAHFYPEA